MDQSTEMGGSDLKNDVIAMRYVADLTIQFSYNI